MMECDRITSEILRMLEFRFLPGQWLRFQHGTMDNVATAMHMPYKIPWKMNKWNRVWLQIHFKLDELL